jgi:hypothetical protein
MHFNKGKHLEKQNHLNWSEQIDQLIMSIENYKEIINKVMEKRKKIETN